MNKVFIKQIKDKNNLWFKLKSFSHNNAADRTELQEQYRSVSNELNTDFMIEVIGFESNLAKNSKHQKMLYSYIISKKSDE